jgi:hypothetical protein
VNVPEPIPYTPPDFSAPHLVVAPAARVVECEADGVLPERFFATTNLPSYVKGDDGQWRMPREPRWTATVRDDNGTGGAQRLAHIRSSIGEGWRKAVRATGFRLLARDSPCRASA